MGPRHGGAKRGRRVICVAEAGVVDRGQRKAGLRELNPHRETGQMTVKDGGQGLLREGKWLLLMLRGRRGRGGNTATGAAAHLLFLSIVRRACPLLKLKNRRGQR